MAENEVGNHSDEEIIALAKERFKIAEEAWQEAYEVGREDLKFRAGEQWPDEIKRQRADEQRPCLTINKMPQFVHQITNDQRQNRPTIKVSPVDEKADVETAKILQGMIRHIEYNSGSDVAYDTAFDGAVNKGFGFFRVLTDYVGHDSFDQEILIKPVPNDFGTYIDPFFKEPDGSDINWGFIFDRPSKGDFKAKYKNAKLSSSNDWGPFMENSGGWIDEKSCLVAEYFYKDTKEITLVLLEDGSVFEKSKVPQGAVIIRERKAFVPSIKWCKIAGNEIIEKQEWIGQWIPIIPVFGAIINIDARKIFEGIIRHAKDPQRMYNFWATAETETIALAPKAPFIGVEGQFEGHEEKWRTANQKSHPYLEYRPVSIAGQPASAPQRNSYEPPVQAITNARIQSGEDIKATTGIYDASLGARSNEISGRAILGRQAQAQTSNFHFIDNLTRSIRHCGRILIDLMPKVYDTARAVRILGDDGTEEVVRINDIFEKNGKQVIYDISIGKYDVVVQTGPSFATKRQEAVQSILEFVQAYPQAAQVIGDLLAKNMDWPGAQEISERLKKLIPPHILGDGTEELPPQAQAQIAQLTQAIQMLQGQLAEANAKLETKILDLNSKERIAFAQMENDIKIEAIKAPAPGAMEMLLSQLAEINQRLDLVGINQPIGVNPPMPQPQPQNFNGGIPQGEMLPAQNQPTSGELGPYMGV